MRLTYTQEYLAVLVIAWLMRAVPRPLALVAGAALGQLGWWSRIRRRVVLANLAQALPGLTEGERRRVGARSARNFGRTVTEFVRFAGRDRTRLSELVAVEGLGELRAALDLGKGTIVVTGHLGAWALYVSALSAAGLPTALLVGRQKNPQVDAFIHSIPGEHITFISKGRSAPKGVLTCLNEGMAVVMVADQYSRVGIPAPFLGRTTKTLALPGAVIARRQVPLVLMAGHRVAGGRHRVELRRVEVALGDAEADVRREVAAICNRAIGEAVLEHPDQYFWYHRRWRNSDDQAADPPATAASASSSRGTSRGHSNDSTARLAQS